MTSPLTSHTATTHPMAPSRRPLTLVMSPFSTAAWSGNLCDLSCLGSGAISTGLSEHWPSLAGRQDWAVLQSVYSTTLTDLTITYLPGETGNISPPTLSEQSFL